MECEWRGRGECEWKGEGNVSGGGVEGEKSVSEGDIEV